MAPGPTDGAPAPNESRRARMLVTRYGAVTATALLILLFIGAGIHYRSGSNRRRYEALLRTSLDRIVTAQEGFYYDSTRYAASLRALPSVKLPSGVHVQLFNSADRHSWWGVATYGQLSSPHCVVWVGTPPTSLPREARAPEDETKPLCFDDAPAGARRSAGS